MATFNLPYLNSYTTLDTITLRNGKEVEILELSSPEDDKLFQKGKQVFLKTFEKAYSNFSAQDLFLNDELGYLRKLLEAAFEDEENDFKANKEDTHFLVARVTKTDNVIGFVAHDINPEKSEVYIRQLAIASEMQEQGLGKKMTLGIIGKIATKAKKVLVCTRKINEQAKQFYYALGFKDSNMKKVHPQLPEVKYQGFELLLQD